MSTVTDESPVSGIVGSEDDETSMRNAVNTKDKVVSHHTIGDISTGNNEAFEDTCEGESEEPNRTSTENRLRGTSVGLQ